MHKDQCASLSVSEDGRYLLTAGHNAVKVWDYNMKMDVKSQVCVCVLHVCNLIFITQNILIVCNVHFIYSWWLAFYERCQ